MHDFRHSERRGFGRRGNLRRTMVDRRPLARGDQCGPLVLHLSRGRSDVLGRLKLQIRRRWSGGNASRTAIEADTRDVVIVDDSCVVDVVHNGRVHIVDIRVVVEDAVVPPAALVPGSGVPVAVVDAAIETDAVRPVATMPRVAAFFKTPVSRRPEIAHGRCQHPGSGNPVIVSVLCAPSPVARRPDIAFGGYRRLFVNGKRWRRDIDGNRDGDLTPRCQWGEHGHRDDEMQET